MFQKNKNSKFFYYASNFLTSIIPSLFFQKNLHNWLEDSGEKELEKRVNYYINFFNSKIPKGSKELKNFKRNNFSSAYYYDLKNLIKYFPQALQLKFKPGDIFTNQDVPTVVKSRPIKNNGNSVLLKLNKVRHYNFVKDTIPFKKKKNLIVWRGVIHKENRRLLVDLFHNHPKCDIGTIAKSTHNKAWQKNYLNISSQLTFKYILSIEGHDVATNLKWIMSSNSLCFMPKPKFETWFMEGLLQPNIHYVLLKDDYSDIFEKMDYYEQYPEEALKIIKNANEWTYKFKNKRLEKKISLRVLQEYFKRTNQI